VSRVLGWLGLGMVVVSLQAGDTNRWLQSWFDAQGGVKTWSAGFVQTRSLKALTRPLTTTGQVWVGMPDCFRWELGQPAQTIALRQPQALWVIYPRLNRAEKYSLAGQEPGPWRDVLALLEASFPRSRSELESRFRIKSVVETNATVTLGLQPKIAAARQFLPEVLISFRTNDFSLTATEMRFVDGSTMRNDFTNAVLNGSLPAGCFEEQLAPGTTVVEPLKR
jgi:outer membrane lipoprotein-sorting protein